MGLRASWRARGRRVTLAALLTGFACNVGVGQTSTPLEIRHWTQAPELYRSWAKTADLVRDPETRKRVDALAALTTRVTIRSDGTTGPQPTIETEAVGESGSKSATWAAFHDLAKSIDAADAIALLRHESPGVRAYFARHVATTMPGDAPDLLYPLFGDPTNVGDKSGCTTQFIRVADLAFDAIVEAGDEINVGREDFFKLVIGDARLAPETRGKALAYFARIDATNAHALALLAARDADLAWRREGIHALGLVGYADDVGIIAIGTTSADWHEREESVKALGNIDAPASRDKIAPLLHDPQYEVQTAAASSYAAQTCANGDVLAALLKDKEQGIASAAGRRLAESGTLRALEILEPSLMNEEEPLGGFELDSLLGKVGAPGIPVMRRLLSSRQSRVRDDATEHLRTLGASALRSQTD